MISNHLSRILGEKRKNITALSKETGISRTTLTKLYYCEEQSISYAVAEKICKALDCTFCDLFCNYSGGEREACLRK